MPDSSLTRPRSRLALGACALAALAGGMAPAASGAPKHASTSTVAASIAYTDGSKSTVPVWKNIRITIKRGDAVVVDDQLLPLAARDSVFAAPKLLAVDLDDDGEAEVVVDAFTAGVECCRRSVVYRRSGNRYDEQVLRWADSGYRLADVIGRSSPEFLASDARFPKAWDADARGPLRVFAMRKGKVRDVSRRAPRQLRRDARIHQRALRTMRRRHAGDARPVVAAYVADLVRLGEVRRARIVIRGAARRHELQMSASAFERNLDKRLVSWGYSKHRVLAR